MKEWGHLLRDEPAVADDAAAVSARVHDVTELLAAPVGTDSSGPDPTKRSQPRGMVAVHDPCHLVHAQKVAAEPRQALRAAGFDTVDVPDSTVCCGAAGLYNLLQPEAAAELGRNKAEAIVVTGAHTVSVANPGCAMQIRMHLDDMGRADIRVAHPVELIAERS